jgi:4'-phosphopantetheinyl transferase
MFANFQDMVSPDERARAMRFRVDHLQKSFIFTRGTLRLLLGRYLELTPKEVRFRYSETGKPSVDLETPLRFNTSHSGDVVLFAFARERDLGVDVEQIRALSDIDSIVSRFFRPEEVSQLTAPSGPA